MLAPLDNEIVFTIAFQNKIVFTQFVKNIIGIDFEGKFEIAKNLTAKGMSMDFIQEVTGFSFEEIEKL